MTVGDDAADRDAPRRPLAPSLRAVVVAFAEAALSDEEGDAIVVRDLEKAQHVADEFEQWTSSGSASVGFGLRAILALIELLPLFVIGRFSRMSRLPLRSRIHYLEALERSPVALFATAFVGLKIPIITLCFEEGAELHASGFDRPGTKSRRSLPIAS